MTFGGSKTASSEIVVLRGADFGAIEREPHRAIVRVGPDGLGILDNGEVVIAGALGPLSGAVRRSRDAAGQEQRREKRGPAGREADLVNARESHYA
jgi:hypothetical protein